jgi:hypothetical protein
MPLYKTSDMRSLLSNMVEDRQKKRGEMFCFYHRKEAVICWGNKPELVEQMKIWRKQKKQGILHMNPKNNRTKIIGGQTFYILVVQQGSSPATIDPIGIDPFGVGFDEGAYLVDGLIYAFKQEANRDAVFGYVNGVPQ